MGFRYRKFLSEIISIYVVDRLDIYFNVAQCYKFSYNTYD